MSLSVSRSTLRAKEIGIRKVIGSSRGKIAQQFFVESALYSFIAFIIGFIIFSLTYKYFFNLIDLQIDIAFIFSPLIFSIFGAVLIVTIFIAGSYPSFILSSFKPVAILSGKWSGKGKGNIVRKLFTVIQFTISITLIIFSIIILRQIHFLKYANTGIDKQNILMIPFDNAIGNHYLAFKNDVSNLHGVNETATSHYPMFGGTDVLSVLPRGESNYVSLPMLNVDNNFISLFNIKWKIPPQDSFGKKVIINNATIKKLNLPANPLNSQINLDGASKLTISGVVQDFNFSSLREKIDALCLIIQKDSSINWGTDIGGCLFVKINDHTNIPALISAIKKVHDNYDNSTQFEFHFLDDVYNSQYKADQRLSDIINIFSILTIFIACLGLLGLSTSLVIQKKKEIGIRKILGASIANIVVLLSKNFILLIVISNLIAFPISWYISKRWLGGFAYRINIGWEVFILTFLATIIIAYITLGFQAIKSAVVNPVKSLRTE